MIDRMINFFWLIFSSDLLLFLCFDNFIFNLVILFLFFINWFLFVNFSLYFFLTHVLPFWIIFIFLLRLFFFLWMKTSISLSDLLIDNFFVFFMFMLLMKGIFEIHQFQLFDQETRSWLRDINQLVVSVSWC